MPVPVRPGVFVPEADHVPQFVDYDAELVAVLPNGDRLSTTAAFANERAATVQEKKMLFEIWMIFVEEELG